MILRERENCVHLIDNGDSGRHVHLNARHQPPNNPVRDPSSFDLKLVRAKLTFGFRLMSCEVL